MLQLPAHIAAARPALHAVLEELERRAARTGTDAATPAHHAPPHARPNSQVDLGWPLTLDPPRSLRDPAAFRPPASIALERGAVHEFFAHPDPALDAPIPPAPPRTSPARAHWTPPMGVLLHAARRAALGAPITGAAAGAVVFVGRRVWPAPAALAGPAAHHRALADRALFIDAQGDAQRLWATDLCLRSHGVTLVIADASGLNIAATRRLQLAAASTPDAPRPLAALARPAWELRELSAAQTRWLVRPSPEPLTTSPLTTTPLAPEAAPTPASRSPTWTVELLRSKGDHALLRERRLWRVSPHGREGEILGVPLRGPIPLHLAPDLRDRPLATA